MSGSVQRTVTITLNYYPASDGLIWEYVGKQVGKDPKEIKSKQAIIVSPHRHDAFIQIQLKPLALTTTLDEFKGEFDPASHGIDLRKFTSLFPGGLIKVISGDSETQITHLYQLLNALCVGGYMQSSNANAAVIKGCEARMRVIDAEYAALARKPISAKKDEEVETIFVKKLNEMVVLLKEHANLKKILFERKYGLSCQYIEDADQKNIRECMISMSKVSPPENILISIKKTLDKNKLISNFLPELRLLQKLYDSVPQDSRLYAKANWMVALQRLEKQFPKNAPEREAAKSIVARISNAFSAYERGGTRETFIQVATAVLTGKDRAYQRHVQILEKAGMGDVLRYILETIIGIFTLGVAHGICYGLMGRAGFFESKRERLDAVLAAAMGVDLETTVSRATRH